VTRSLLLLVLLAVPGQAAPRLKDRPPSDPEEARIAALKSKYEKLRTSGSAEGRLNLESEEGYVYAAIRMLDDLAVAPPSARRRDIQQGIWKKIESDKLWKDLYDIEMYDRKNAAGGK
jgi:hypothetical protein